MSEAEVTTEGVRGARPDREATTGTKGGRRRRRRGERPMVPEAEFTSYYGKPVINAPVWEAPDIPGYLFLGGLAGLSSVLAAGSDVTGRGGLAKAAKTGAFGAGALSLVALVHDLGRPERFLHMLRVVKVTSPMNVGSWLLGAYVPAAGVAAAAAWTGKARVLGALATAGAALFGPAVAAYTAVLISDTAVPAWHEGYREMPFVFVGSGATAAGGLGLLAAPTRESGPARNLAVFGVATELAAFERMRENMGMVAGSYETGKAKFYVRAGEMLSVAGAVG
ncbi:MAG TPA: NrfD/PsrC family molybdoenzyme membrane anchor subunit, partial [Pseudonocardiaceae bacterium]|nr:NrfD/PsrC family molybdoenzyme membrane anchor subunit [Pseudonocardiaceae bacterium]